MCLVATAASARLPASGPALARRQQELRREMTRLGAALASFDEVGTLGAGDTDLLEQRLWVIGAWTCSVLDGDPGLDAATLARRIRDLDPRFGSGGAASDDDDARLPTVSVVRLGDGAGEAFVVSYHVGWSGAFFVVAQTTEGWRVVWTIRDAARAAARDRAPWDELVSWLPLAPGFHDGPLAGRVEPLEPGASGRPRFYVDAITLPDTGQARPGQISVWEWDGAAAVPVFVARYPTSWRGWRVTREGVVLRIATAEQASSFFTCGSCAMSDEPAGVWTLRLTPQGVVDEGHRWETPELELLDTILSRLASDEPTLEIATPAVVTALRRTLGGEERFSLTMLEAFGVTTNADGSTRLHLVSDDVDDLELTVVHRANGLYATAIEIQPFNPKNE
jgi:hypothetical protein